MNRILIVEDEPNVRLNYRLALELEGYEVRKPAQVKKLCVS